MIRQETRGGNLSSAMSEGGSGDAGTGRGRGRGRGVPNSKMTETQSQHRVTALPCPCPGAESSPTAKKSLRKPCPQTQTKLLEMLHNSGSGDDVSQGILYETIENQTKSTPNTSCQKTAISVADSQLSVDADVFVPAGYQNPDNVDYEEFDTDGYHDYAIAIGQLQYTLDALKTNPGSFDDFMTPLVDVLRDCITVEDCLDDLVSIVFEQATGECNFQYMGAKVCSYLSSTLTCTHLPSGSTFRQRLLKKCQEENKNSELNMQSSADDRVRGFTMFLAELFLNMIVNGSHMQILIKPIHNLLETLLAYPSDENFKCVAKVLKLSGAALEDSGTKGDMDSLLVKVKAQESCPNVQKCIVDMLQSVITLRSTNWGRSTSPVTNNDESFNLVNATDPFQQPEPVFYNAQGQTITRQEAGFSVDEDYDIQEDSFTVEQVQTDWSNPDELCYDICAEDDYEGDAEMDEEMAEAFEKFVLETEAKKNNAI